MAAMTKKKKIIIGIIIAAICLIGAMIFITQNNVQGGESPDAPPTMPAGHEERFDNLGPAGCYGCHGANDEGKNNLTQATALPLDHYANSVKGSSVTDLSGEHMMCNTCHVLSNTK